MSAASHKVSHYKGRQPHKRKVDIREVANRRGKSSMISIVLALFLCIRTSLAIFWGNPVSFSTDMRLSKHYQIDQSDMTGETPVVCLVLTTNLVSLRCFVFFTHNSHFREQSVKMHSSVASLVIVTSSCITKPPLWWQHLAERFVYLHPTCSHTHLEQVQSIWNNLYWSLSFVPSHKPLWALCKTAE